MRHADEAGATSRTGAFEAAIRIETDHEARVFDQGINFFHIEN